VEAMGEHFTELKRAEASITEILRLEETRFKETLDRGLKLLGDETDRLGDGQSLPGDVAFKLYDTFGFPLDLTADILRGQGRDVDQAGYDAALEAQRAAARASWKGSGEAATETLWFDIREDVPASEFLGYDTLTAEGAVLALVNTDAKVESLTKGDKGFLIANQTPFYAESGGQQGDRGTIAGEDGLAIKVLDTQKRVGDLWVHEIEVESGTVKVGDPVAFLVDGDRRASMAGHHSATHLLHEALRQRLGAHVAQKGSLVAADRLRFDFSHNSQVSNDELADIEVQVNEEILANTPVQTRIMSPDEAIEAGATALFGEKYGDEVRVVTMGTTEPS
ncbi:MAG: alanine--tRNA ligase-related protein, partial [Alphaproteobacteria bacterium]